MLRTFPRLLPVCFAVCFLFSPPVSATAADPSTDAEKQAEYYKLMQEFVTIFEQIEKNYVKDVDRRELIEAAIKGMVDKLDPYSSYIAPSEFQKFRESVDQRFGGIGIQVRINPDNNRLTVITPLPGTPAYKAGIRPGDIIEEIEGKTTRKFSMDDAIKVLKGKVGEKVKVGVRHKGSDKIETLNVERAIIQMATVLGDHYKPDGSWNFMADPKARIGYIRLTHFSERSSDELIEALKSLKKDGMKGLVLDLRNNPGGLLSQATQIADLFIESGRIVSVKGKNTEERVFDATKFGTYSDFPIAVLVNRYSASASEILSACLQDHKRAIVVGERTWGKGSVQNVIDLAGGAQHSALKLTTASYHRPSGKNIHRFPGAKESDEWGVVPDDDYRIRFSDEEFASYFKFRRDRDVLSQDGPPKSKFDDRQFNKAKDYVLSQLKGDRADKPKSPKKAAKAAKAPENARKPAATPQRSALPVDAIPLILFPNVRTL